MRRLCSRPVAVGLHVAEWGGFFARPKLGGISTCPPSVFILVHNIKPCVVCEGRRDALLIRAIFLVSGMMIFDYGLDCAHLSPMRDVAF